MTGAIVAWAWTSTFLVSRVSWGAPPVTGDACTKAKATAKAECCTSGPAGGAAQPVSGAVDKVTVKMPDGTLKEFSCVHVADYADVIKGATKKTVKKTPAAKDTAGTQSCKNAGAAIQNACYPADFGNLPQKDKDTIAKSHKVTCDPVVVSNGLPFCEALQASSATTKYLADLQSGRSRALGDLFQDFENPPMEVSSADVPFAPLPGDANQPPSTDVPATPGSILGTDATIGEDPEQLNDPVETLRLEIPGSFLRYYAVRAGIAFAMNKWSKVWEDEGKGPVQCDVSSSKLECKIFTMKAAAAGLLPALESVPNMTFKSQVNNTTLNVSKIKFADDNDLISAELKNAVVISMSPIELDLMNKTRLGLLPLHDPESANGYATQLGAVEKAATYLDRARVVSNLTDADCKTIRTKSVTGLGDLNGTYVTFLPPYLCRCDKAQGGPNYCIHDPYPRPEKLPSQPAGMGIPLFSDDHLKSVIANGAKVRDFFCTEGLADDDPLAANAFVAAQYSPSQPTANAGAEYLGLYLSKWEGFSGQWSTAFAKNLREFGCSNRLYGQSMTQKVTPFGNFVVPISSGVGFEFRTQVQLPKVDFTIPTLSVTIKLGFLGVAVEWLKERWWGWLIGWFLELIQNILETLISVVASGVLIGLQYGLLPGNTISSYLLNQNINVQGVLTNHDTLQTKAGLELHSPTVELGIRRIVTSKPKIMKPKWGLEPFADLADCINATPSADAGVLNFFLELISYIINCTFQLVMELLRLAIWPLSQLLDLLITQFWDYPAVIQKMIATEILTQVGNLSKDFPIAEHLVEDVLSIELLEPYHLNKTVNLDALLNPPGTSGVLPGALPAPLQTACGLAPQPELACLLAETVYGNARKSIIAATQVNAAAFEQTKILRLGAKTHFLSIKHSGDFQNLSISHERPPVRYCLLGDTPPLAKKSGTDPYSVTKLLTLSDLKEVDVTAPGNSLPLDWRTQCAAFFDLDIEANFALRLPSQAEIDVQVLPRLRTNELLNLVFVCERNNLCDINFNVVENNKLPIRRRAELAMCSLAADIWYRGPGSSEYRNLMHDLASGDSAENAASILPMVDEYLGGTYSAGVADATAPMNACTSKLQERGYTVPKVLLP